mmetsp:Transcript_10103/g.25667  ORF Transcript_10103/g.25667 Transcript_10103/m.25667 type:complete len:404 (-) Transcript_10103:48-1259(-)
MFVMISVLLYPVRLILRVLCSVLFPPSVIDYLTYVLISVLEANLMPDFITRMGIRLLLRERLDLHRHKSHSDQIKEKSAFVAELRSMPVAINTDEANEQHYELPTDFFKLCLGPNMKYSSCIYPKGNETLEEAERAMLTLYCERAKLGPGQRILELGCGWGSLCLFIAERYPTSRVKAVSNSRTQREHIMALAFARGIKNLQVVTANMVEFDEESTSDRYDRIVSVEMLEHMKNYDVVFRRVSRWLAPNGLFFCHVFAHKHYAYHFEDSGKPQDWMARHFFLGGTMPSADLFLHFQRDLDVVKRWWINGCHYSKTLEAWLRNQDRRKRECWPYLVDTYGDPKNPNSRASRRNIVRWWVRWRVFYIACSELFRYNKGEEWGVLFYLFRKRPAGGYSQSPGEPFR